MKNYVLEQESQILNDSVLHLLTRVPLPKIKQGKLNSGKENFGWSQIFLVEFYQVCKQDLCETGGKNPADLHMDISHIWNKSNC